MSPLGALHQAGKLQCPYAMCNKTFEKPIVLCDESQLVRETYYACPHCRSKIEIDVTDPMHPTLAGVDNTFYVGQRAPVGCPHGFGYLRALPSDVEIPDECAVCPKVVQCSVRKSK